MICPRRLALSLNKDNKVDILCGWQSLRAYWEQIAVFAKEKGKEQVKQLLILLVMCIGSRAQEPTARIKTFADCLREVKSGNSQAVLCESYEKIDDRIDKALRHQSFAVACAHGSRSPNSKSE